jgi:hypothetical protein
LRYDIPGAPLAQSHMTEKQVFGSVEHGEMGESAMSRPIWGRKRDEMHISRWISGSSMHLNPRAT